MSDTRSYADRQLEQLASRPDSAAKGTPTIDRITVTTTATPLAEANADRITLLIYNAGATAAELFTDDDGAFGTGWPLPAGAVFEDANTVGAWYALTASGSTAVAVLEVTA